MNPRPYLDLAEFQYDLPSERIAKYPLGERDQSKLLVWNKGSINHVKFKQLPDFLPDKSILFFNDTKVIPARLAFKKPTGSKIEVFLLSPAEKQISIGDAMTSVSPVTWHCAIGNAKRWPDSLALVKELGDITLSASWVARASGLVKFTWTPASSPFASIIAKAGAVPLPPYLNREAEPSDREQYQTVYSRYEGAVAAPTAGLHFTPSVLADLKTRGIPFDFLTLHVSAGTFLPIKTSNAAEHLMHREEIVISKRNLMNLMNEEQQVIAVGTTALRSLESLYWYGVKLADDPGADFEISQDLPYQQRSKELSRIEALRRVLARLEQAGLEELVGHTAIYVMHGYRFRITNGLITNFHQPGSSLLVLVSALVGPAWKAIYDEALSEHYRFLSYGDSSLLLP